MVMVVSNGGIDEAMKLSVGRRAVHASIQICAAFGLASGLSTQAFSQDKPVTCGDLIKYFDGVGGHGLKYDPYAASEAGWFINFDAANIIDPAGAVKVKGSGNQMSGTAAPEDAIVVRFFVSEMKRNGRSVLRQADVKFDSRWVASRATFAGKDGSKSRCSEKEPYEKDRGGGLFQGIRFESNADITKYMHITFTPGRAILQAVTFDVAPEPTKKEADTLWLTSAYQAYFITDKCVEMNATSLSRSDLRSAMRSIEVEGKARGLDTEQVWKAAAEESKSTIDQWTAFAATAGSFNYEQRRTVREACSLASGAIALKARETGTGLTAVPKKDF